MSPISSADHEPKPHSSDPFWLTSNFSTKELEGQHVRIEWVRGRCVAGGGIYRMELGSYGHSRHIQSIHAVLVEGLPGERSEFDFDQMDADLLHRSNEDPKRFTFFARLDAERPRTQNPDLDKLVRQRRWQKMEDVSGLAHWHPGATQVLQPMRGPDPIGPLSDDLHNPCIGLVDSECA